MSDSIETPDGVLIAATLAGDREPFAVLVGRYQSALMRTARSRMGRPEWAEDVVQETLLCAFKFLPSYDSRYSFRTWLWTILLNQCRRHLKKRSRDLIVRPWTDEASDTDRRTSLAEQLRCDDNPAHRLAAKERSELLDVLLSRLPEAQADALRLRFFGGLKYREISDAMQCSLSTAKNRVRWGLTKMAEYLGHDENSNSPVVAESIDEDRTEL